MILELDCGNSLIKWRVIADANGALLVSGVAGQPMELVQELLSQSLGGINRCRLVSVRGDAETNALVGELEGALGVGVQRVCPAKQIAGVVNGYWEQNRLGLDRWLAIIAAYHMCRGPCLVIDLGTAVTVDLVAFDGRHLGGYIAPGIALLRGQLLAHTRRIQYEPAESSNALDDITPGRSTVEGVERGCLIMLRSYVASQIGFAGDQLGKDFTIYVTGGDAALVADFPGVRCVPDLVFSGLALACP
ncbi:type III pantothenate kinase [Stutzerimonas stutzeri]|uniref:type III pantothenate kinase n=1 Tax=Stutzerimonas stutzeri TaxID=316 RepID=UPI000364D398|nr:type III pantothenate kinase [Stutzerimonas stutzeri]